MFKMEISKDFNTIRQEFDINGYYILENAISNEVMAGMLADAKKMHELEPERIVWNEQILFRKASFRALLNEKKLIDMAINFLGSDVQLLALDLRLIHAKSGNFDWHRDINFICNKTLAVNTGIYLQDTSSFNGGLKVVPGTHRIENLPENPNNPKIANEVSCDVKRGSAVFHESGVWHTASSNESSEDCWAIFPHFGHYWIKRMTEFFTQPLPISLSSSDNPIVRQLIGKSLINQEDSLLGDGNYYNLRGEKGIDFV